MFSMNVLVVDFVAQVMLFFMGISCLDSLEIGLFLVGIAFQLFSTMRLL